MSLLHHIVSFPCPSGPECYKKADQHACGAVTVMNILKESGTRLSASRKTRLPSLRCETTVRLNNGVTVIDMTGIIHSQCQICKLRYTLFFLSFFFLKKIFIYFSSFMRHTLVEWLVPGHTPAWGLGCCVRWIPGWTPVGLGYILFPNCSHNRGNGFHVHRPAS